MVFSTSPAASGRTSRRGRARELLRLLALMGPAFVVGAWQFGPGNLTSAVQAGSGFGYALLWVIAISTVLMLVFTDMSVRIAIRARGSLIETVKQICGRPVGVLAGVGVFVITLMFSVGNTVGAGLGLSLVLGGEPVGWSLATVAVVAAMLLTRGRYGVVEKVLLVMVAAMAVCFAAAAVLSSPDWPAAARGFAPSAPAGAGLLLVALVGTNFSINAAFYTGYASRERGISTADYRRTTLVDTIPGILAPGIMTCLVIITAASALGGTGAKAGSLGQLAAVLEPVAGPAGQVIFALGFFGAAFSAMLANATAGGTLLADGLGWGNRFASRRVRLGMFAVLAVGAAVTATAAGSPVQLIVVAQSLTVVVAPLLGVLLMVLANNRRLMGELGNRWWQNVLGIAGLATILATCGQLVLEML